MKTNLVYLSLTLVTLFWGGNFNVGKFAMESMTAIDVASWRFIIATLTMLIILLFKTGVDREALKRNIWVYMIMGLLGVFGFNLLWTVGLSKTLPVNGSLIMAFNPTITVVLSALISRERIQNRQIFGLLLSFAGVMVVALNASLANLKALSFSIGDLFMLASNLCWALNSIIGKRFLRGSSAIQTTAFSMLIGSSCLFLTSMMFGHPMAYLNQSTSVVLSVVFMGSIGSALAYILWNNGITVLGASRTSVFFDLIPIWTMVLTLLGGDSVSGTQLVGSLLVIFGVLFSSGFTLKKMEPQPVAIPG